MSSSAGEEVELEGTGFYSDDLFDAVQLGWECLHAR